MQNLDFNQKHYDQMLVIDEDYKAFTLDELQKKVQNGADIVTKNKGFSDLQNKCSEEEMIDVGAFIDFRLAKKDLGEYVEEIDD